MCADDADPHTHVTRAGAIPITRGLGLSRTTGDYQPKILLDTWIKLAKTGSAGQGEEGWLAGWLAVSATTGQRLFENQRVTLLVALHVRFLNTKVAFRNSTVPWTSGEWAIRRSYSFSLVSVSLTCANVALVFFWGSDRRITQRQFVSEMEALNIHLSTDFYHLTRDSVTRFSFPALIKALITPTQPEGHTAGPL